MFVYFALAAMMTKWPDLSLAALAEPFGMVAFGLGIRYLTSIEANVQPLELTALLIGNRALWVVIAGTIVVLSVRRFRFVDRGISARGGKRQAAREKKLAAIEPVVADRLPANIPASAALHQLRTAVVLEMKLIFKSPAFWVLAIVGSLNLLLTLNLAGRFYGVPAWPRAFVIIDTVRAASAMLTLLIAIYFSGEVVWRERERRFNEIIDATPMPNWIFLTAKLVGAVGALLVLAVAVVMLESVLFQLTRGIVNFELGGWLAWFVLPSTIYVFQLAVLSIVVQAISPNKFVGWAIMLLYLITGIAFASIGLDHPLLSYADVSTPLSDMNGSSYGGAIGWWLRLYWMAAALILIVIGHLMWRRGIAVTFASQIRTLPQRLRGTTLSFLAIALVLFTGLGGFLFYNMNVLNPYPGADEAKRRLARYEQRYARYVGVAQPTVTDVRLKVDLYPARSAMQVDGMYRYTNRTAAPVPMLHIRMMPGIGLPFGAVSVAGATLVHESKEHLYRIYRFDRPLQPGASGTVSFRIAMRKRGLAALPSDPQAHETDAQPAANGAYLTNFQILPLLGMNRTGFLEGNSLRRDYGLRPQPPIAKLEGRDAQTRSYAGMQRLNTDITVTTDADQTPVATGARVSDVVIDGRRTARFVSPIPSFDFITIQSARYDVRTADTRGVKLQVYYHPDHATNIDRMLGVMRESLDYYRKNFGPYQYPYARIIERPGYGGGANSAAGTIGYSEKVGFVMDLSDPKRLDFLAYLTAHELAHQYWFHQVMPADTQGAELLTEGLAQYSALMVMKQRYGQDQIREFLERELDLYLQGRRTETAGESPLGRSRNQGYIHYNKASIVMYLLQDRLGENRVNAMLGALIDRYSFKPAPYARSSDLVDGFLSLARTSAERRLIMDQFHRITLYDLKVAQATVRQLRSGQFETTMIIHAGKHYADARGNERPAALSELIDVGVFTARPGDSGFKRTNVVSMQRLPIRTGLQRIHIVTTTKPLYAGVDPYISFIDRNLNDNVISVGQEKMRK